eukprot:gene6841-4287_t
MGGSVSTDVAPASAGPSGVLQGVDQALVECTKAIETLAASKRMLALQSTQLHTEARAILAGDGTATQRCLATKKRAIAVDASVVNLELKIAAIERHRAMMEEQRLNRMMTEVLKKTSMAMRNVNARAAGRNSVATIDDVNSTYYDVQDRMAEVTEAMLLEESENPSTADEELLAEMRAQLATEPPAVEATQRPATGPAPTALEPAPPPPAEPAILNPGPR